MLSGSVWKLILLQKKMSPIKTELPKGQVMVTHVSLDPNTEDWKSHLSCLSIDEQKKVLQFHYEGDKLRFAKCRSVLRKIIGMWLNKPYSSLMFKFGKHGKPHLDHHTDIHFNISHTQGHAVLAFARDHEIGIDIENTQRDTDIDNVAQKVFTKKEQELLFQMDGKNRKNLFFRLWTAKESFLKATGRGLTLNPQEIEAILPKYPTSNGTFLCNNLKGSELFFSIELTCQKPYTATLCAPSYLLSSPPLITNKI